MDSTLLRARCGSAAGPHNNNINRHRRQSPPATPDSDAQIRNDTINALWIRVRTGILRTSHISSGTRAWARRLHTIQPCCSSLTPETPEVLLYPSPSTLAVAGALGTNAIVAVAGQAAAVRNGVAQRCYSAPMCNASHSVCEERTPRGKGAPTVGCPYPSMGRQVGPRKHCRHKSRISNICFPSLSRAHPSGAMLKGAAVSELSDQSPVLSQRGRSEVSVVGPTVLYIAQDILISFASKD